MNNIQLTQHNHVFLAKFKFSTETKDIVKECGFKFNRDTKDWWTDDLKCALALAEETGDKMRDSIFQQLENKKWQDNQAYQISDAKYPPSTWYDGFVENTIDLEWPDELTYMPYQIAFLEWWKQRTRNGYKCLLEASEMGIGKTVETVMIMNILKNPNPRYLIICPAGLKINWEREIRKWSVKNISVQRIDGEKTIDPSKLNQTNTSIINYDILPKHRETVDKIKWDLIVCDEAHYLKSPKAKRTQAVLGGGEFKPLEGRKLFLTGTPLINRPAELWTLVKACDPNGLGSHWHRFHERYCEGHKNRWGGWDLTGARHLDELQVKLRSSFMMRRRTDDVLDQLPAIRRQAIVLPVNGNADLIHAEQQAYDTHEQIKQDLEEAKKSMDDDIESRIKQLRSGLQVAFGELSKARKRVGVCKIPYVAEHVLNVQESRGKTVVFAHHVDVIDGLMSKFEKENLNPVRFSGTNTSQQKQASVDSFQYDANCRVIVLNIEAGGVGITLTGTEDAGFCTSVVFAELDWRPASMDQAERRVARLGADDKASHVIVHHVVLDGSLDATMSNKLIHKQKVIDQAINIDTL